MKKRLLKIFGITAGILLALVLIAGGTIGFFARREILAETFTVSEPELPAAATDSAQGIPVGSPFEVKIRANAAFSFDTPFQIEFSLPDGLESRENVEQHFDFAWTHRHGEIRLSLIAFNAGEFKDAKLTIEANAGGVRKRETLELPPIFAVLPESAPGEKLRLAGTLDENPVEEKNTWFWLSAVIIPLLALAALIILRKKKQTPEPEIPAWVAAQNELDALRGEIVSGRTSAIAVVTRISDIVRRYLSRRFGLSADAMTSQEFFASMERTDSPLASKHKQFLREFLSAADLIKFAGVAASADQAHTALDRASSLVCETVPVPETPSEKN